MSRAEGVALLLAGPALQDAATRSAGIRVALERQAWLAVGSDLVGQRVTATVTRHRWAAFGGRADLDLWFAEGRRIDPLLPSLAVATDAAIGPARPALRVLSA